MIVIFVEFIDQLIDYPINRASLTPFLYVITLTLVCKLISEYLSARYPMYLIRIVIFFIYSPQKYVLKVLIKSASTRRFKVSIICVVFLIINSNILRISPPETESFQIKILIFFIFLLKTYIVGTR